MESLLGQTLFFVSITLARSFLSAKLPSNDKFQARKRKHGRVEICLCDIESVQAAIIGKADSIELCCARSDGGLTPSLGLIKEAVTLVQNSDSFLNILIRPRVGNFVYSDVEFEIILKDIIAAKDAGADGVVVGFLDVTGAVNKSQLAEARRVSQEMELTFHRAFDVCANPSQALEDIIAEGCDRLLTSGCCSSAGSDEVSNRLHLFNIMRLV